jgi:aldose 1-epimerase
MDNIALKDLKSHRLDAGDMSVTILSLGCITHDWRVPLGDALVPIVLSYRDPADHLRHRGSLGIIAGRVANRIANAQFSHDGTTYHLAANEGRNQLHGGPRGLASRNWSLEPDGATGVQLSHRSPDGDQGFPGNVDFTVTIQLQNNRLIYDMIAMPDRATPINLAQHSYYNLMGSGTIWDHQLQIASLAYTPTDGALIPTGKIAPLDGQPFDYRQQKLIRQADPSQKGADVNLVLDQTAKKPAATLSAPNGLCLKLWTDQPGLQLYTGAKLSAKAPPMEAQTHQAFAGLCLEPQHFPDAPNQSQFPSIICTPERPYHQRLTIEVSSL